MVRVARRNFELRSWRPVASVVGVCLLASFAGAAEPGPDGQLITLEAKIVPSEVALPQTTLALCLQNVNRRSSPGLALLAGDAFTFRIDPARMARTRSSSGQRPREPVGD